MAAKHTIFLVTGEEKAPLSGAWSTSPMTP